MSTHLRIAGLVGAAALLAGCTTMQSEVFTSEMSAAQAGRTSPAGGSARFELDGTKVNYTVDVTGLNSAVLAVHIHAGGVGAGGARRVDLFVGPTEDVPDGQLVAGSFDAEGVLGITFRELLTAMRTGQVYVNVHTRDIPPGEMRGQVYASGAVPLEASITGPAR